MGTLAMTDYKDRYFDGLDKTLGRIEDKVDKNTDLTESVKSEVQIINSRVSKLESWRSTFKSQPDPKILSAWYKDPAILRILTYLALALLLLTGAAIKIDISELL